MGRYPPTNKSDVLASAKTEVEVSIIKLSKISQAHKTKSLVISLIKELGKFTSLKSRAEWWLPGAVESSGVIRVRAECVFTRYKLQCRLPLSATPCQVLIANTAECSLHLTHCVWNRTLSASSQKSK